MSSERVRRAIVLAEIVIISALCTVIAFRVHTIHPVFGTLPENSFMHTESVYASYYEPTASSTLIIGPSKLKQSTATINHDSLNERFDYLTQKRSDTFRIALLGDSFAFGLYVDTQDNVAEQLEDMLNAGLSCPRYAKFELLNFGVPAYDIEYAVERYRLRGAKYDPDMVLWLIEAGDFLQVTDIFQKHLQAYVHTKQPEKLFDFFGISEEIMLPAWEKSRMDTSAEISSDETFARENAALYSLQSLFDGILLVVSTPAILNGDAHVTAALQTFVKSRPHSGILLDAGAPWRQEYQVSDHDAHFSKVGSTVIAQSIYTFMVHDLLKNQLRDCTRR